MRNASLTAWRRISQAAFILFIFLMPVLDILRIDTDTRELILFGTSWSFGIQPEYYADRTPLGALKITGQFFLKGILPWVLFLAIFPLLGWLTGRLFCGWLCPEGALFELSDFLTLKLTHPAVGDVRQHELPVAGQHVDGSPHRGGHAARCRLLHGLQGQVAPD